MDTFTKENLIYEYNWSQYEKDDPRISGIPDTTEFNRKEGEEVFYIINHLTDHIAWDVGSFARKVEQLIHNRLPKEITNQKGTIDWIRENWKNPPVEIEVMKLPEAALSAR
jgi:hypothetical protein